MKPAQLYIAGSRQEQAQNLNLSAQERECRRYCQRQDFHVDKVYVEEGESAKTVKTREFKKCFVLRTRRRSDM